MFNALGFCSQESDLDEELIKPAVAAGCDLKTIGKKGALKWLWKLCRKALEKGDMKGTTLVDDGKPLGPEQYKSLKDLWFSRHHFFFTSFRILGPVVIAKMFKHASASPKQFVCIFAEEMKLKSSTTKQDSTAVSVKPGEMPSSVTVAVESVTGVGMFRDKLEALFNTWAFVSIHDASWFSYQDALRVMDTLNEQFKRRYRGSTRPALEYFVKCYMKTMNYLVDEVSVHGRTLGAALKKTASWIHFWNSWDLPMVVDKSEIDASMKEDSIPQAMKLQMRNLNKMATKLSRQISNNAKGQGKGQQGGKDRFHQYTTSQAAFPPISSYLIGGKGKDWGKGKSGGKGKPGGKNGKKGGK